MAIRSTDHDYKVTVKVQNGLFLKAMADAGIKSIAKLSRDSGVSIISCYGIANLKITPFDRDGSIRDSVASICEFLGCLPEDIYPEANFYTPLMVNAVSRYAASHQIESILLEASLDPFGQIESQDRDSKINRLIESTLTSRSAKILKLWFGFERAGGATLEEIGVEFGVSRERVNQIIDSSLRKLRGRLGSDGNFLIHFAQKEMPEDFDRFGY